MIHQGIEDFVRANGQPNVTSLDDVTHLFHFDKDDWRNSPLIFVNRNGNHMRIIEDSAGSRKLAKTWTGMMNVDDWHKVSGPRFDDPEKTLNLISVGPGIGKRETLSFLPKEACVGRRRAVFRQHILKVFFSEGLNSFRLQGDPIDDGKHVTLPQSGNFTGKLWESQDAVQWCLATLPTAVEVETPNAIVDPYVRKTEQQRVYAELEDHPLWGGF